MLYYLKNEIIIDYDEYYLPPRRTITVYTESDGLPQEKHILLLKKTQSEVFNVWIFARRVAMHMNKFINKTNAFRKSRYFGIFR